MFHYRYKIIQDLFFEVNSILKLIEHFEAKAG